VYRRASSELDPEPEPEPETETDIDSAALPLHARTRTPQPKLPSSSFCFSPNTTGRIYWDVQASVVTCRNCFMGKVQNQMLVRIALLQMVVYSMLGCDVLTIFAFACAALGSITPFQVYSITE